MSQIGRHDDVYLSTPLEQKLAWFQNAPGLSAVEPARQFMSGAAALYTDSDAQVRATLRTLGADWTGDAATNAGATLQRAADWSQEAGASHGAGGKTVEGYGRSFESLRGQVHWDDPWAWGWTDTASAAASVATLSPTPFLSNLTADYFTTAQQNRTNDATAVAALRAHEEQTRTAVESFPSVSPARIDPGAGSSVGSPPAAAGGSAVGVGDSGATGLAAVGAGLGGPLIAGGGRDVGRGRGGGSDEIIPGVGPAAGIPGRTGADGGSAGQPGSATSGRVGGAADGVGGGPGGVGSTSGAPGGLGGAVPVGSGVGGVGDGAGRFGGGRGGAGEVGDSRGGAGGAGGGRGGVGGGAGGGRGGFGSGVGGGPGGASGAGGGRGAALPVGGEPALGGSRPGGVGGLGPDGRIGGPAARAGGAFPGDGAGAGTSTGADPRLRGGDTAGGWRDLAARPGSEPGLISRGPAAGSEFAARLPSGAGRAADGAGMPFLGGMGVGAGAQPTEHRNTYWIRSAEPFDVPLPPHSEGVLHGGDT